MKVNNANEYDHYEISDNSDFEIPHEDLESYNQPKKYKHYSKNEFSAKRVQATEKAKAAFEKRSPDKTISERNIYCDKVKKKFNSENTFTDTNSDEYFNEEDLFLLAKLAILHGIKTDKLKEQFLLLHPITISSTNYCKAVNRTNYNITEVVKRIKRDPELTAFLKYKNSTYIFGLFQESIKEKKKIKVRELISNLNKYRAFVLEQQRYEKLESEVQQLNNKLIISEQRHLPLPAGTKHLWQAIVIKLKLEGYKPRHMVEFINNNNLFDDNDKITNDMIRSFLKRHSNVTQKDKLCR